MTSYEIIKPFDSKVLGKHDSGVININPFTTGNDIADNFMNVSVQSEVEALIKEGNLKAI